MQCDVEVVCDNLTLLSHLFDSVASTRVILMAENKTLVLRFLFLKISQSLSNPSKHDKPYSALVSYQSTSWEATNHLVKQIGIEETLNGQLWAIPISWHLTSGAWTWTKELCHWELPAELLKHMWFCNNGHSRLWKLLSYSPSEFTRPFFTYFYQVNRWTFVSSSDLISIEMFC